jgi:hypothetical protein
MMLRIVNSVIIVDKINIQLKSNDHYGKKY